jgi:hypothetical protein
MPKLGPRKMGCYKNVAAHDKNVFANIGSSETVSAECHKENSNWNPICGKIRWIRGTCFLHLWVRYSMDSTVALNGRF